MSSEFGRLFRITTWGESHGGAVGVVVDGCPPRMCLAEHDIQRELDRRRPGQSHITTPRGEEDVAHILSGVFEGKTLGTPISILVWNRDARSGDYDEIKDVYRPSHADFTYDAKYGIRDWRGGGRASARETIGRVAAGAIARKLLGECCGTEIVGYVKQVRDVAGEIDAETVAAVDVESSIVRCPDQTAAGLMIDIIDQARRRQDSVGGIVEVVARNVPAGLGEPVFDKLSADLAKGVMSIPAAKGFEIGSGFGAAAMTGAEHNDPFCVEQGRIRTQTNSSGGIQGGISNGESIVIRAAFKPTATIGQEQQTVDTEGRPTTLAAKGRHDPCVLPRAVPVVEAMVALVLADHYLRQKALCR